jgi:hypothetical protein
VRNARPGLAHAESADCGQCDAVPPLGMAGAAHRSPEGRVTTTLAVVLADCGDLPHRLVDLHAEDGTGHCVVCAVGGGGGRKAFPCSIRSAATAALIIRARRHNPP